MMNNENIATFVEIINVTIRPLKVNKYWILLLGVLLALNSEAQDYTISGKITDQSTGENLIGANVFDSLTYNGTTTNSYGYYSIKHPKGKIILISSYVGYKTKITEFSLSRDTVINIALQPSISLKEVVITDKSPQQTVRSEQMSTINLPVSKTQQLPVLLGEVDLIKSLQLLPGVNSGTEGTSGMYIRGGAPDQNLILLDGVPVYNVNHLFGIFSVFNSDAIQNVDLTKGGFPARYGGRLSSVLDIRMKEGNMKEFKAQGSVGLLASKLTVEGPIKKDTSSFIISGRRTYFDLITYPFQILYNKSNSDSHSWTGYFFYDLNTKVNYKFSDRSRLYFSNYIGRDKFFLKDKYEDNSSVFASDDVFYNDEMGFMWGNITSSLRWNYIFNNNLFSNSTFTYSDYKFTVYQDYEWKDNLDHDHYKYNYNSKIRDWALKIDFDQTLTKDISLKYGLSNTLHTFVPGVSVVWDNPSQGESGIDSTFGSDEIHANEFFIYGEGHIDLTQKTKVNAGIHYSGFMLKEKTYHSLEPRISARYLVSPNLSIKASYAKMTQHLHLLANSTIGLPTDLWVPSTTIIKPQKSWQAALGGAYSLQNTYEITLEGYYKEMQNLTEYKEGASFFSMEEDWEEIVTTGRGWSYGMELLIRKNKGNTTGWIGYTLSWANRKFKEISFGRTFPFKYDHRHDLSIVLTHKFNDKFDVGINWVYNTGNAITIADEQFAALEYTQELRNPSPVLNDWYNSSENLIGYFETRNSYRMPDYHRLDVGLNFHKEKKWGKRSWHLGVYNVYARQNPMFLYSSERFEDGKWKTRINQVSILLFIPYIRYSFKL